MKPEKLPYDELPYFEAPLIYTVPKTAEEPWTGRPSVAYGMARLLAFKERQKQENPYVRILFGFGGNIGGPWGGLNLEINGKVYTFGSGLKRFPEFFDENGELNELGKKSMGEGMPAELACNKIDWRWIQNEVDISCLLSDTAIQSIETYYATMMSGALPVPTYQSQKWSENYGLKVAEGNYNCTTIIANLLNRVAGTCLTEAMPIELFNKLKTMVNAITGGFPTDLDCQLNALLWMEEGVLMGLIKSLSSSEADLKSVAKGEKIIEDGLCFNTLMESYGKEIS